MLGALGDLDSPGVLIIVGATYLGEFAAERNPTTALLWNALHAVIRPLSGVLLGLLLLDGHTLPVVIAGSMAAGAITSWTHSIRSGGAVLRWLGHARTPNELLVSALEDVATLGLVALALDLPAWACGAAFAFLVAAAPVSVGNARAFVYATLLLIGRPFRTLRRGRWSGPDDMPDWVNVILEGEEERSPGGTVPRHAGGRATSRRRSPIHERMASRARRARDAGTSRPTEVAHGRPPGDARRGRRRAPSLPRVDLSVDARGPASLFVGPRGPGIASLRAEFGPDSGPPDATARKNL